ncbi:uncharacterized protein BXZ73DRAFT_88546 [Epithele typhae]|uniref:uncharacterized protein n=1 Tax=Epithele typhae TaxID=378194 RepID=UPI00200756E8|nr:uncharacterized protein BXZ73DRAFT_88546 [Epithele typhae]KAH9940843.1 hypothetical protein BXZ73DRAFT_88546 [Epithele typhae]
MVSSPSRPLALQVSLSANRSSFIAHVPPSPSPSIPPSPSPSNSGASSSSSSSGRLSRADDEDATVKINRASFISTKGKHRSHEYMTELTYSISDIQTRIFEIQELRHKSQGSKDAGAATGVIDQSLVSLDEKFEAVSKSIKAINDVLEPLLAQSEKTPTVAHSLTEEESAILRGHASLMADWDALQKEIQDKWLTVFRTVTDQADGMMSSLEKAVNRCQDFMVDDAVATSNASSSVRSDKPLTYETFMTLLESFEAKKKHYMPATTKVLSIIDKGVQDRVTKNGECLRRHAECTQRWRNLKERIARTDNDMDNLRRLFLQGSDRRSARENQACPLRHRGEKKGRSPSTANTISRSISPFRKIARKLKAGTSGTKSPAPGKMTPVPARVPHLADTRTFALTPDSSPSRRADTAKSNRPAWNSSTKVEAEAGGTIKPSSRQPSISGRSRASGEEIPPVPALYQRSLSRSSMSSSRPWSPVTSSASTAPSSNAFSSLYRSPSRAHTPGLPTTPGGSHVSPPRTRPKTPSYIPGPSQHLRSMSGETSPTSLAQRAMSPTGQTFPARPPSRSMIPIPSVHVSSASRPGTSMSYRPDSAMSFRASANRAATPEGMLRMTPRPRLPPSSFRDGTPGSASRPGSRAGAETPLDDEFLGEPLHWYTPGNGRDPLDTGVAAVVNAVPHGLKIERVDPPLRQVPKEGEEVRAQYAFTNAVARKVVTCKLTTMHRSGGRGTTKKVMCRVGGGWQDLRTYVLSRG